MTTPKTLRLVGMRPKPRALLLGSFDDEDGAALKALFPTIHRADGIDELSQAVVSFSEIDIVIVGSIPQPTSERKLPDAIRSHHVICFSPELVRLPGPVVGTELVKRRETHREEALHPSLPLAFDRLRQADLAGLENTRGWIPIGLSAGQLSANLDAEPAARLGEIKIADVTMETAVAMYREGAILLSREGMLPLAVALLRLAPVVDGKPQGSRKGVAWFPNPVRSRTGWIAALCTEWSKDDPDGLGFQVWQERPEWMTAEELRLREDLENLEQQRKVFLDQHSQKTAEIERTMGVARREADAGVRRLLTAQDDALVEAVAEALGALGFRVEEVDSSLEPGQARREDLRLEDDDDASWNAIVEVRGYAKSGGKTSDFQRLGRFAMMYERSEGRPPAQRLYIVNGQLDLPPDQRERPLASAREDVDEFSKSDGAIVWTVDLFRARVALEILDRASIRQSIRAARGLWTFDDPTDGGQSDSEEGGSSDATRSDAADEPSAPQEEPGLRR